MSDYHDLVIEGPRGWTLGFIHGYLCGAGTAVMPLDAEAEGVACEALGERVREVLHPASEVLHLLAREDVLARVRQALAEGMARDRGVRLAEERVIRSARFEFSLRIYSREHAARIRELFTALPPGVELTSDSGFKELIDPAAEGAHSLAPAHGYELRGEGVVEGPFEGVLSLHRICRELELIKERPLRLLYT